MRAKIGWPAAMTAAVLVMAVSAYAIDDPEMDEINYNHDPQTEDPDRDVKDSSFPFKVVTTTTRPVTNATRRPLQCFFCSYNSKMPRLRTCLDPNKFASSINITSSSNDTTTLSPYSSVYKMMTKICRSVDDQCFTSVVFNATHEIVHRGCSSDCVASIGIDCCKTDRCNYLPVLAPERFEKLAVRSNGSTKSIQSSILLIVTIMLVLHTAIRVAFV